jgi:transketolase
LSDHDRPARPRDCDQRRNGDRGRLAGATFPQTGFQSVHYDVFALCGDGLHVEIGRGCSAGASAARNRWIYDSSRTIEKHSLAFTEDVADGFTAYGWHTYAVSAPTIRERIAEAIATVKERIMIGEPDHRREPFVRRPA